MSLQVDIIDPTAFKGWNDLVITAKDYSFFHSSNWAKVLCETYGYKPAYLSQISDAVLVSLLPLMEVYSIFTGRRGVSLPFTDYCNPIIGNGSDWHSIRSYLYDYGHKSRWKFIELRGGECFLENARPYRDYRIHSLDISTDQDKIYSKFRESTKRNIKKAIKSGVEVHISRSKDSLKEYYGLHCITRKQHGIPPQPFFFFDKIYEHIIAKDYGVIAIARYQNKPVAGAVYFHLGQKAIYKYGASNKDYQHTRANNLVMWEAIKWYYQKGYKDFCFGRTDPENKGLIQFKSGWGSKEHSLNVYRYSLINHEYIKRNEHMGEIHTKIFKNIPMALSRLIGSLVYKHVG